jgi:hypothetical protein
VKRVLLYCSIFLGVVGFTPIKTLQAPQWKVRVVDESNMPVADVTVRESYQNYSAQLRGNEQDLVTDQQGYVIFPAKTLWSPIIVRIVVTLWSAMTGGVHASFGPHAYVFAFGDGVEGSANKNGYTEDWTGSPSMNESRIILLPSNLSKSAFGSDSRSPNR